MALKSKVVTITSDNRDKGKQFIITEMPAAKFEKWALKAITAMGRAGLAISDEVWEAGAGGLAVQGFKSIVKMDYEDAQELMDLMFECFTIQPDPSKDYKRSLTDTDIEEIATRLKLRAEWWELQTGFQIAGGNSPSTQGT